MSNLAFDVELQNNLVETILADIPDVLAIYLFGSRAAGSHHATSDIDLAILTKTGLPAVNVWQLAQRLAAKTSIDTDIIDMKNASTIMRMQIISQGERLYCSNEDDCERYEDFIFSDYARLNEERAEILEDIRQRGSVYG
jgi:predicted nucleotidyltransferase